MPTLGVSMRKVKAILRLRFEAKLSQHQVASSLQLSVGVVNKYIQRAVGCGLGWPLPAEFEEEESLRKLLKTAFKEKVALSSIDFAQLHQELKYKGVTLQLLWEEYRSRVTHPLSYSHYCLLYRSWKKSQPGSMRQTHRAGDKVFVDYTGKTIEIVDHHTGEIWSAQVFLRILVASNYTFAEDTWTQQLPD